MIESVGKKLQQARQKRSLSIEEAAHATKLRPDMIVALENDDYARFASNAYAKGFLQIYGRFLRVDVAEYSRTLDSSNPISVSDYQYLSNGMAPREDDRANRSTFSLHEKRRTPSIMPLVGFVVFAVVGVFAFQMYVKWQRVANEPVLGITPASEMPTPIPAAAATPAPVASVAPVAPAKPPLTDPVAPVVPPAPLAVASDRDFVAPTPAPLSQPANEVLVEPIKKTWITVRRDDPKSAPVFEDYLYPDTQPLKLKGSIFFIEARDPAGIQIRKNGTLVAYQGQGVEVR